MDDQTYKMLMRRAAQLKFSKDAGDVRERAMVVALINAYDFAFTKTNDQNRDVFKGSWDELGKAMGVLFV